ncbi:hypothetical protein ACLOJK_007232, partial [Asimina triloba]
MGFGGGRGWILDGADGRDGLRLLGVSPSTGCSRQQGRLRWVVGWWLQGGFGSARLRRRRGGRRRGQLAVAAGSLLAVDGLN